jgi:hypothetical protein
MEDKQELTNQENNSGTVASYTPTDKEIEIMKHALGYPKLYRNYFNTSENTADYPYCENLVKNGMMDKDILNQELMPGIYYSVTDSGRKYLGV